MPKKRTHAQIAKSSMKALNVYKPQFEGIIKIYGELCEQYEFLTERFTKSGYNIEEDTLNGTKKAPIVTTLESLRKDILTYAAQLGLTPMGLLKANEHAFAKKKKSAIAEAIKECS